ncbi:MAG: glycoside hydrolase family 57 protein [Methyloprofundus sp.]|nr:glycoside hydrolase family 57 protein [Methyloprofundus sp.]
MSDKKKLKLVLCWHMHQPEYRDLQTGEFQLPWTYLHVIKDYVDMVAHLEAEPNAKAVVNFAPILLEQIEDYAKQVNCFLHDHIEMKDPLLAALATSSIPANIDDRQELINNCMRANRERQIDRYPAFKNLVQMAEWIQRNADAMQYINSQFIDDFLVWYHLAWMGETVKLSDVRIQRLIAKERNFTLHDRLEMIEIIGELLSKVICRYKSLATQGRIELSVTPYAHPIIPLLLDIKSAHEAMPRAPLPELDAYPGGEDRAKWHLKQGIATFKRFFGFTPEGCWPSEGAVSTASLKIIKEAGFSWTATGGQVLHNSLNLSGLDGDTGIHHPFQVKGTKIPCFFRDDGLSDLIGFKYSKWHADDAVNDMIHHLETIAENEPNSVVSIIMDGENAWEYFPENGYHFLNAFYQRLANHPDIELTTFSECLEDKVTVTELPKLMAGSWVYGTFSTWIGDPDKNRGWDMLGDAKWAFDKVLATGRLSKMQIMEAEFQLAVCEGSDWFWWFGDYNPGQAVSSFEKQFRLNLANLYYMLGEEPPAYLALSFTQGSGAPAMGGTMRKGND